MVTDQGGDNAYVVMDLDHYELLVDAVEEGGFEPEVLEEEVQVQETDDFPAQEFDLDFGEEEEPTDVPLEMTRMSDTVAKIRQEMDIWDTMKPADQEGQTWDMSQLSQEELSNLEQQYQQFAAKNVQEAISETVSHQEEPVQQVDLMPEVAPEAPQSEVENTPLDEEFGEEQFYLEPVE